MLHEYTWLLGAGVCRASAPARQRDALIDAVKAGNRAAVRALLKQRADVNAAEADGMTALHWAVRGDDLDTVQLLIRAGANVKAANRYGITPLVARRHQRQRRDDRGAAQGRRRPERALPEGETVLMTAARDRQRRRSSRRCSAHGANVNAKETWQGQTALMWAAAENHAAAIKALVGRRRGHRTPGRKCWSFPEYRYETNGMAVFQLPRGRLDGADVCGAAELRSKPRRRWPTRRRT